MPTLTTLLTIFQQAEYDPAILDAWVKKHPDFSGELTPTWTLKAKLLKSLSVCFPGRPEQKLSTALRIIQPFENLARLYAANKTWNQMRMLKRSGMKVVAIAGSYGKTSTKQIMQHVLGSQLTVVATPKSFNTLLGIHQIVKQITPETQLFIVELGEFKPGDLAKLVKVIPLDYLVITPIGRQHVEYFGSEEGIAAEFRSLVESSHLPESAVLIAQQNQAIFDQSFTKYGTQKPAQLRVSSSSIDRSGTEFSLSVFDQKMAGFTPLYGEHQVVNVLPSIWLAHQLQLDIQLVIQNFASQPYVERRHEPTFAQNEVLILDNSYNTNPDSIRASLQLLKDMPGKKKIVVTLGFVEQGRDAHQVHYELGVQLAAVADAIGLIKSRYVSDIEKGYLEHGRKEEDMYFGNSQQEVIESMRSEIVPKSVVLLEGGVQEVYQ